MKNFQIQHRKEGDIDILELHGELDAHTASHLEEWFKKLLELKRSSIIVNCNDLEYIASAGLGVFMAYIEDLRELGGDIKLTNMNGKVYDIFNLLGFPALYDIVDDERDALKLYSDGPQAGK
ncbi:MAG: STAS domain-containing protein [Balneolaceae bacterium]